VTRLRDMGLEDYLLAAVLRGVLAQRLVRRLCPSCRRPAPAPAELISRFGLEARCDGAELTLHHPVGCADCRQTGYRGRFAIAEFLTLNPEIEHLIFARADHNSIEKAAIAAGMTTLLQCGLDGVLAGETTVEEVVRSVRAET
jgi:general secretion pathway protein E